MIRNPGLNTTQRGNRFRVRTTSRDFCYREIMDYSELSIRRGTARSVNFTNATENEFTTRYVLAIPSMKSPIFHGSAREDVAARRTLAAQLLVASASRGTNVP